MRRDEPPERIQPGQVVARGRYVLLEVLGRGGLATVFRAQDTGDGSQVALKVLRDRYVGRPEREERLRREFEYAKRVVHPAVIEVYERGTLEDGRPFFSMERVHGLPLSWVLSGSGGLPFERMRRLSRALAVALHAVHRAGIVHRDVKPANVLVLDGDPDRIKLIDFGMAGDGDAPAVPAGHTARLTRANDLLGTHEYMAPEQVLKQAPRRSMDVFALGVVMYELLSSMTPYSGMRPREYVELQIAGDPLLRSAARWGRLRGAPAELAPLIDECRRRDPAQRPADMQEVIRRLDALELIDSSPVVLPGVVLGEPVVGVASRTLDPAGVIPIVIPERTEPSAAAVVSGAQGTRTRWRPVAWAAVPVVAVIALGLGSLELGVEGSPTMEASTTDADPLDELVMVGTPDLVLEHEAGSSTQAPAPRRENPRPSHDGASPVEGTADPTGENGGQDQAPATEAPGTGEPPGDAPPSSAKPRARPRSHPVAPEPPPSPTEDECTQVLTRARVAFASYRWPAVLAHTRDGSCWSEHEAEYLMIRTEALMEEGRWAECVRTGRRSSDPIVRRHAERCQKRLATITGTP